MKLCRQCRGLKQALGYLAAHEDAERRMKEGDGWQQRCEGCGRFEWVTEFEDDGEQEDDDAGM